MFNPTSHVIDGFVEILRENYFRVFGLLDPDYPNIIRFAGRIALENIANSDATYHDVSHTIMVTLASRRRAVSISCTFIRKSPSPAMPKTVLSGATRWAAIAPGSGMPIEQNPFGIRQVLGSWH